MNSSAMSVPGAVPAAARTSHPLLWAAVGALGATTLALGAALVQVQHHSADEVAPAAALTPASAIATVLPEAEPAALPAPVVAPTPQKTQKVTVAPAKSAHAAPKTVAKFESGPRVAATTPVRDTPWEPVAAAPQPTAKVVCASCGIVESVTPIQREANPSGAGAVAGAVLGGLVGNQFGGGDGKALATIAGVLGGGWAGNTVEKRMKKETVYQVDVRMDDGSLRRIEQNSPVAVGAKVNLEGNAISPAHPSAPNAPIEAHAAT